MTLFETLVAIVILALAAAGFLGSLHAASRSVGNARAWVDAVGWAEAAMEETKLGTTGPGAAPSGLAGAVELRPWAGLDGIEQATVTVGLPGGGSFVLHRLLRRS
jgi:type II secretory pathway pseudopilin PulG